MEEQVKLLNVDDPPEIYGIHENVDVSYQLE